MNVRAMQAKGLSNDVNVRCMSMGSWHANLSKEGIYYKKSSGGVTKKSMRSSLIRLAPPKTGWVGGDRPEDVNKLGRKIG